MGPEARGASQKRVFGQRRRYDWAKGGGKKGKGKGNNKGYGKKGVYGVDSEDDAWKGDPVAWAAAAAADVECAKESEDVGAVYDQDEQYYEFCACIMCDIDDEDVSEVSTSEFISDDFVCGIDALSDSEDDLVTAEYRGLRDVVGWQRKDPWGGSADARPKRASISSTPTFILTLIYIYMFLYSHIYSEFG